MKQLLFKLLAVLLLSPLGALATPITYIYSGTGVGTLGGQVFVGDFVVEAQADTDNIGPWCCSQRQNTHTSAQITLQGFGTYTFLIATHTWSADNCCGGFGEDLGGNLLTLNLVMGNYDLASNIGPLFDAGGTTQGQFVNVPTSGGALSIVDLRNGLTFEARVGDGGSVPEPATLALIGLGLVASGMARRRRQDRR